MDVVQRKVVEVMGNNWRHEINNKIKLRIFKLFKDKVQVETYTCFMYDRQSRFLLDVEYYLEKYKLERFSRLEVLKRLYELCNLQDRG